MVELKNSAACRCSRFGDDGFVPAYYEVKYEADTNSVFVRISGKNILGERGEFHIDLEKSEAAKFGADIVAAATGVKE